MSLRLVWSEDPATPDVRTVSLVEFTYGGGQRALESETIAWDAAERPAARAARIAAAEEAVLARSDFRAQDLSGIIGLF